MMSRLRCKFLGRLFLMLERIAFWVYPRGRWVCAMAALTIGIVRITGLPSYQAAVLNDQVYGLWFAVAGALLLLTMRRPWSLIGRLVAGLAAGAFAMLGVDVVAKSITSGVIPWLLAYHLTVTAVCGSCQS